MTFITIDQARFWCTGADLAYLDEHQNLRRRDPRLVWRTLELQNLPARQVHWLAGQLLDVVGFWEEALLWVTDFKAWGRENLQLYYRLRQSYGDYRLLSEASCQIFLGHERHELQTSAELMMMNGWSGYLLTSHDYGRLYLSAGDLVEVGLRDGARFEALQSLLLRADINLGQ